MKWWPLLFLFILVTGCSQNILLINQGSGSFTPNSSISVTNLTLNGCMAGPDGRVTLCYATDGALEERG